MMINKLSRIFPLFLLTVGVAHAGIATDGDADGVADIVDNCLVISNPDQRDTDGDGIGNFCDQDINNDCQINFLDLSELKAAIFTNPDSSNWNPDADFNGDEVVNFLDLAAMKEHFFSAPGPTFSQNLCSCTPPPVVPQTPNVEFNGQEVLLLGSIVQDSLQGANNFSDQGGGLYLARAFVGESGEFDYRASDQTGAIEYCSHEVLLPYAPLDLPFFGCAGSGTVEIPAPGCYEFVMRAAPGIALPPSVELNLVERLGRWDIEVDAAGGLFDLPNGLQLEIPAGAVSDPVTLTLGDIPCEQVDALFDATAISTHDNRCLGAFAGEPDGFTFAVPVTARLPVSPLVPAGEIPLWLTSSRGAQDYTLIETALTYRGDVAEVEATLDQFSIVASAAGVPRALPAKRVADLPGCCLETPTPLDCCCTTFQSISTAGDTTSTGCDCELLGFEITTEFPDCPGSPVFVDKEMHSSENCPTDLEGAIAPAETTLWTCEARDLEARIIGTNDDGSECGLPLPATWSPGDNGIASIQETGPSTARVTGVAGGVTTVEVTTPVGAEFAVSAPVTVVSLAGQWSVMEDGSQTCIISGGEPFVEADSGSGNVNLTVEDCSTVTIGVGIPGVATENGPLTVTGNPELPLTFVASLQDSPNTLGCRLFTLSDGQLIDFGEPVCPPNAACQALSCSETNTDNGSIGPAASAEGTGDSSWDFSASWQQTIDEMTTTETIECVGSADVSFSK